MRLIDADELEEMFLRCAQIIDEYEQEDEFVARGMNCYGFKKLLDEQETAYDVDKIIENLLGSGTHMGDKAIISLDKAIEIVKAGGKK